MTKKLIFINNDTSKTDINHQIERSPKPLEQRSTEKFKIWLKCREKFEIRRTAKSPGGQND